MIIQQQSFFLVLLNVILYFILYGVLKPYARRDLIISRKNYYNAFILCVIFCVFSFWGTDWFHYLELFPLLKNDDITHMEEVYYIIAQVFSPNYILFRVVVWGTALIFFVSSLNRLSVNRGLTLFVFASVYLIWFSYTRVSLAMALALYGYAVWKKPYNNKFLSTLVVILTIGASFFCHKSSMFLISMILFTELILRLPKRCLLFICLLLPIGFVLFKNQIANFMLADFDLSEGDMSSYISSGQNYLNEDVGNKGLGIRLQSFLEKFPYYLTAYISLKFLQTRKYIPYDIKAFMCLQLSIVLFSSLFILDLGVNTSTIYGRFIKFAAIPTSIVIAYLYQNRIFPKITKLSIRIAVAGAMYALLYSLYCSVA